MLETIDAKKTALFRSDWLDGTTRLFMARSRTDEPGILVGEFTEGWIKPKSGIELKPILSDMHILDGRGQSFHSTLPKHEVDLAGLKETDDSQRSFEWNRDGKTYLASQWELFLDGHFHADSWDNNCAGPGAPWTGTFWQGCEVIETTRKSS